MSATLILVGIIGAPQGVRGEVRIKSYTATPTAIADYRPLLGQDGKPIVIESLRPLKDDMVVARIKGVSTREAAGALTNQRLFVDRAALPPPDEEEFYHADLIGLSVESTDGHQLGEIVALPNYGAGDLLEIQPEQGDTILVPFTKAFVPTVDLPGRKVVLSPQALEPEEEGAEDASSDPAKAEPAGGEPG